MITTTPIKVNLAELDTHPLLTWTLKNQALAIQDLTPAGRTVELWYWERAHAGVVKKALWMVVLTKSGTPTDGKATYTPSTNEPYYPAALLTQGRGERVFVGWLRYHDTGSTPVTHKWVKDALEVTAEDAPTGP